MTMTEDKKFKYIICERVIDKLHDDKTLIKSVIFNISRYGRFNKKLIFYNFVTIRQAIENVEEYLSEKVTPDYYETIKDDLFYKFNDYGRDINYIFILFLFLFFIILHFYNFYKKCKTLNNIKNFYIIIFIITQC